MRDRITALGGNIHDPSFESAMERARHALKAASVRMEVAKSTASIDAKQEVDVIHMQVLFCPLAVDDDLDKLEDERVAAAGVMEDLKDKMVVAEEQYVRELNDVVDNLIKDVGVAWHL